MAIYWPTPGFKERTFKLCVIIRWDFNEVHLPTTYEDCTVEQSAHDIILCLINSNPLSFLDISPDITLSGWVGSKHQLTNLPRHHASLRVINLYFMRSGKSYSWTNKQVPGSLSLISSF